MSEERLPFQVADQTPIKAKVKIRKVQAMTQPNEPKPLSGITDATVRLVIAARTVAFGGLFDGGDDEQQAAIKELDEASEAFAASVPWEDEPDGE
jgi:hypothetical protein